MISFSQHLKSFTKETALSMARQAIVEKCEAINMYDTVETGQIFEKHRNWREIVTRRAMATLEGKLSPFAFNGNSAEDWNTIQKQLFSSMTHDDNLSPMEKLTKAGAKAILIGLNPEYEARITKIELDTTRYKYGYDPLVDSISLEHFKKLDASLKGWGARLARTVKEIGYSKF